MLSLSLQVMLSAALGFCRESPPVRETSLGAAIQSCPPSLLNHKPNKPFFLYKLLSLWYSVIATEIRLRHQAYITLLSHPPCDLK
jgi:hypothetical protein